MFCSILKCIYMNSNVELNAMVFSESYTTDHFTTLILI